MACGNTCPCVCPHVNCKNHGKCCACVESHRNTSRLPFCLYPEEEQRTELERDRHKG